MTGRLIAIALLITALIGGGAMYWLQVYAFYDRLDPDMVTIRITEDGTPREIAAENLQAIDSDSSPIRFRACLEAADLTGDPYPDATPLVAPGWFDCFDATKIGEDLATGTATAYLGEANIEFGIDRVLAVYPDGRAFVWQQINACGREHFDGNPLPEGCPPPPE